MAPVTIVCVLRSGKDFQPRHVQWLAKQAPNIVCLSDQLIAGVETRPLLMDWPGWWAKMEAFGPSIEGDILLVDLDTVILRMPELPTVTTVLRDFTEPGLIGSGFMYVTAEDRARVWQAFTKDPKRHMARFQAWPRLGDQGFLMEHLADAARWGENVRSYKVHCRQGLPEGTDVVCFHGKPRPWDVVADWIPRLAFDDFRDLILTHKGKRFCVMGGAPSLADDLEKVEADVYISTNAHGIALQTPDYLLAMDEKHSIAQVPMGEYLRARSAAPIISPRDYADIRLSEWPQQPRWVLSGMIATWAAFCMGAKVIYLAGCNAYDGNPGYIDEARKIARDVKCPVRVVSGPLADLGKDVGDWKGFDQKETFGRYKPHSSIDGWLGRDGRIQVRMLKPTEVGGLYRLKGEIVPTYRHEVHRLLKHRMVEEV